MKPLELPVFDSMTACAATTGIPLTRLRLAKRAGCPAFVHGRIALGPLLKWIFTRGESEGGTDPAQELNRVKVARERLKLARDNGDTFNRIEVTAFVQSILMPLRSRILELPGKLSAALTPNDPQTAYEILQQWGDETLAMARENVPGGQPINSEKQTNKHTTTK